MKVLNIHELSSKHSKKQLSWRWLEQDLSPTLRWVHVLNHQFPLVQRWTKNAGVVRSVMTIAAIIRGGAADLAVTHGIHLAASYGFAKRVLGINTPHLAWAFTIVDPSTISPLKRWYYRFSLKYVDCFVMFSSLEIKTYANLLNLPEERFQMLHWTSSKPETDPGQPRPFDEDYMAAIGGEGRDYATLFQAMRLLPGMRLVVVASPESVEKLEVPDNVKLLINQPVEYTYAVVEHAEFMLLPTISSDASCGHSTLVAQFLMGKATIVTDSAAMQDYVQPGETALTFDAGDVESLVTAIRTLASDEVLLQRLAENGEQFAKKYCSEETAINFVKKYLIRIGEQHSVVEVDPDEHEIADIKSSI